MTTETNHGRQRPSLISLLTGDHGSKGSTDHPHTTLPPKGRLLNSKLEYYRRGITIVPESSTSTSQSTPNQAASDAQDVNANDSSTPCNAVTG